MNRPTRTILATVALVLVASPAAAHAPATGFHQGKIAAVNTTANRITLTDGTVVRYRHTDGFATTRFHERAGGDPFDCDLVDNGGPTDSTTETAFEAMLVPGGDLLADVKTQRRDGASFFYVTLDTCDGVYDDRDTTP